LPREQWYIVSNSYWNREIVFKIDRENRDYSAQLVDRNTVVQCLK